MEHIVRLQIFGPAPSLLPKKMNPHPTHLLQMHMQQPYYAVPFLVLSRLPSLLGC